MKNIHIIILLCLLANTIQAQQSSLRIWSSCTPGGGTITCPTVNTILYVDAAKSGTSGDGKSWRIIIKNNQSLAVGINKVQLPAPSPPRGIYLLELNQDGKRVGKKLVKN